jgi:mono/diheme cytochrome c family protein
MNSTKLFCAAAFLVSLTASAGDPQAGKAIFTQNCVMCHGAAGKGDGPAAAGLNPKPANFTDPARQRDMTGARQVHVVTAGGPSEKLSPLMPSFGDSLSEKQIGDVIAYVRESFHAKEVSQK